MYKLLLTLVFLAIPSYATCGLQSPFAHRFLCPDTGDPYTNGADFKTFLLAHPWVCGDTIALVAGVEYRRPDVDLGPDWALPYQSDCVGNTKTEFVSTQLGSIPFATFKNLGNYRSFMPLLSTSNSSIFQMSGTTAGSNSYAFRGLRLASTSLVVPARGRVSNLFLTSQFDTNCPNGVGGTYACQAYYYVIEQFKPRNFELDRMLLNEYETYAYAAPTTASRDGNSFLHSVALGVYAPFDGLYIHDSCIELVGYTNTTAEPKTTAWTAFTTATNASPAVLSGTSILTTLGITYNAGCTTATDNFTSPGAFDAACFPGSGTQHAARVIIRGATGNWNTLNKAIYLRARVDGAVDVLVPSVDRGSYIGVSYYDSTTLGAFSATSPQYSQYALLTQYAVTLGYAIRNVRIIDNHLEAWAMVIFSGGNDGPQYNQANVLTGSTSLSLNLSHVIGLKVGMLITYNVPPGSGPSTFCHLGPGNGCAATDIIRTGMITTIVGNTVTLIGWGPDGADGTNPNPALANQVGWWQNAEVSNIEVRGNNLSRSLLTANSDAGKGVTEAKHCRYCLWDGNRMGDNTGGTFFTEAKSQGGTDPNYTVRDTRFSNNFASGLLGSGGASCLWAPAQILYDNEHSIIPGDNVYMEHNLHINCVAYTGSSYALNQFTGGKNTGYIHNTGAVNMAQTPTVRFLDQRACDTFPESYYNAYARNTNSLFRDNISSYGDGAFIGSPGFATCWPTISTDVRTNIVIDTESVLTNQAGLDAVFPGNFYTANYTSFYAGSCAYNTFANCALNASNPYKGMASDGGDPGADIEQLTDRIGLQPLVGVSATGSRWSENAGLIVSDIAVYNMVHNDANWFYGSTAVGVRFQLFSSIPSSSDCSVQLFTNRNRATASADTASPVACNRTGSYSTGKVVTFLFGSVSALAPSTTYFYRIIDKARVMVGEFTTKPAGSGTYNTNVLVNPTSALTYCNDAAMSSGCTTLSTSTNHRIPAASGAVVYWRFGTIGQRGIIVAQ